MSGCSESFERPSAAAGACARMKSNAAASWTSMSANASTLWHSSFMLNETVVPSDFRKREIHDRPRLPAILATSDDCSGSATPSRPGASFRASILVTRSEMKIRSPCGRESCISVMMRPSTFTAETSAFSTPAASRAARRTPEPEYWPLPPTWPSRLARKITSSQHRR